jgi:hypothetical protein
MTNKTPHFRLANRGNNLAHHPSHQTNTCHAILDDQKTVVADMTLPAPHLTTRRFRLLGPALLMIGGAFVC